MRYNRNPRAINSRFRFREGVTVAKPPIAAPRKSLPRRRDLLDVLDRAEAHLSEMIGRWGDGIPGPIRAELHELARPMLDLLIRAGRR